MNDLQICRIKTPNNSFDCNDKNDNKNSCNDAKKLCDRCCKNKFRYKCSKCKKAKYCSKICQINDWKDNHKHKCKNTSNHKSKSENSLDKIYKSQCFCDCAGIKCYLHVFKPCYYCGKNKKKGSNSKDEFTYRKLSNVGWVHKSCYTNHMESQRNYKCNVYPIHEDFRKPCHSCGRIAIRPENYYPSLASRFEINESWEFPVYNGFHKQCVKLQDNRDYTNGLSEPVRETLDRWSFPYTINLYNLDSDPKIDLDDVYFSKKLFGRW